MLKKVLKNNTYSIKLEARSFDGIRVPSTNFPLFNALRLLNFVPVTCINIIYVRSSVGNCIETSDEQAERSALPILRRSWSQVDGYDGRILWTEDRITSLSALFSRSSSELLLTLHRLQKDAPRKGICVRSWTVTLRKRLFWRQKQIVFMKKSIKMLEKHWNKGIALERDYVDE